MQFCCFFPFLKLTSIKVVYKFKGKKSSLVCPYFISTSYWIFKQRGKVNAGRCYNLHLVGYLRAVVFFMLVCIQQFWNMHFILRDIEGTIWIWGLKKRWNKKSSTYFGGKCWSKFRCWSFIIRILPSTTVVP